MQSCIDFQHLQSCGDDRGVGAAYAAVKGQTAVAATAAVAEEKLSKRENREIQLRHFARTPAHGPRNGNRSGEKSRTRRSGFMTSTAKNLAVLIGLMSRDGRQTAIL
jgi:hypothetical protein